MSSEDIPGPSAELIECIRVVIYPWPFSRRLGGVNPRRELLGIGKGMPRMCGMVVIRWMHSRSGSVQLESTC